MAQPKRTQLRHFVPGHHCSMQWLRNSILARLCSEYININIELYMYILYIFHKLPFSVRRCCFDLDIGFCDTFHHGKVVIIVNRKTI